MIDFLVYILTIVGIYGILAMSLNHQYAQTGLVNLGQIVFFLIGAYVAGGLVTLLGWPYWAGFACGILAGGLLGGLMALPTANLQQDYWAIATLAIAELGRIIALNTPLGGAYVGGPFGITGIPQPLRSLFPGSSAYGWFYLGLVAVCYALVWLFLHWLTVSPHGRALKSIREDDHVALALGKDARWLRIRAMFISGAVGGFSGALYAFFNGYISSEYARPLITFIIWAMVILGGAGNYRGVLAGAIIMEVLYNSTRFMASHVHFIPAETIAALRLVVIGILVTVIVLYLPRGLFPEPRRRYGTGASRGQ